MRADKLTDRGHGQGGARRKGGGNLVCSFFFLRKI